VYNDFPECDKIKEAAQANCPVWAEWGEWNACPKCNPGSKMSSRERDRQCSGINKQAVGTNILYTPDDCADETGQPIREEEVCEIPDCRKYYTSVPLMLTKKIFVCLG